MARVIMKVKVAKQYNIAKLTKQIDRALNDEIGIMTRMFQKTTKTWSRPPRFQKKRIFVFNGRGMRVFTTNKKMLWLNRGTKKRWAIMSPNFSPKTRVRVIGSRGGSGGVIARGKRAMRTPRPGIKAREFDKEIARRRQPKFTRKINVAIKKGIKR